MLRKREGYGIVQLLYVRVFVSIFERAKVAEMTTAAQPVAT